MSLVDYLIIIIPGFVASVGLAWIAGMAQMEARKAREISEMVLARLDKASADRHARDASELAALRALHRPPATAVESTRSPGVPPTPDLVLDGA